MVAFGTVPAVTSPSGRVPGRGAAPPPEVLHVDPEVAKQRVVRRSQRLGIAGEGGLKLAWQGLWLERDGLERSRHLPLEITAAGHGVVHRGVEAEHLLGEAPGVARRGCDFKAGIAQDDQARVAAASGRRAPLGCAVDRAGVLPLGLRNHARMRLGRGVLIVCSDQDRYIPASAKPRAALRKQGRRELGRP